MTEEELTEEELRAVPRAVHFDEYLNGVKITGATEEEREQQRAVQRAALRVKAAEAAAIRAARPRPPAPPAPPAKKASTKGEIWATGKAGKRKRVKKAAVLPWDYSPPPRSVTEDLQLRDGEQLSDRAYRMFGVIINHLWVDRRNKDFGVSCTFEELELWSGRVKSTVQLSLEELEERGHIEVIHKGKGNYRILILDRRPPEDLSESV